MGLLPRSGLHSAGWERLQFQALCVLAACLARRNGFSQGPDAPGLRSALYWSTETTNAAGRPLAPLLLLVPRLPRAQEWAGQGPPAPAGARHSPPSPARGGSGAATPRGRGAECGPLPQPPPSLRPGARDPPVAPVGCYHRRNSGLRPSCLSTPIPPHPRFIFPALLPATSTQK